MMMMHPRSCAGAAGMLLAAAILGAWGCSGSGEGHIEPPAPPAKIALIGWDGATWEVIDPLLRQGQLPHLARLLREGSRAVLLAEQPMYSPAVWTSLATGFSPKDHGVTDFQLPDPRDGSLVLASTFHRHRAPIWTMASQAERSVGFVGWWTTWPAEPVFGYMVSDHLAYNRWDAWARRSEDATYQLTFPAELSTELLPHAVQPNDVDAATLTAIVPFNDSERAEMMAADGPVKFHAPSVFRYGYITDASNAAFARHLLDTREQPDLFAVVFILTDVAGHVFWHHYQPERFPQGDPDLGRLRDALPNVYRQLDAWTGEILARLEPGTVVMVLSDHGMGAKGVLPQPGRNPAGDHTPDGILVAAGPGVTRGADLGRRSSLDLVPTLLARLGLPIARDMPGKVIDALAPGGMAGRPAPIDSYGEGRTLPNEEGPSPGAEEYLERLRSLGYVR